MTVRLLTSAYNDLAEARGFYQAQGEGLGDYFLDSIFSEIDSLTIYGGVHRKVMGYHRLLAQRFPHAVYYKIDEEGDVIVYRVLDCRQNPATIKRALRPS